jgi:primosomal protein N'
MLYAEVAVDAPAGRSTYSYAVPDGMSAAVGQLVWVPFGTRTVRGIITALSHIPGYPSPRPVASASPGIQLNGLQLEVGQWIASHYLASHFSALALFLPPGVERQAITYLRRQSPASEPPPGLSQRQRAILEVFDAAERVPLTTICRT